MTMAVLSETPILPMYNEYIGRSVRGTRPHLPLIGWKFKLAVLSCFSSLIYYHFINLHHITSIYYRLTVGPLLKYYWSAIVLISTYLLLVYCWSTVTYCQFPPTHLVHPLSRPSLGWSVVPICLLLLVISSRKLATILSWPPWLSATENCPPRRGKLLLVGWYSIYCHVSHQI